MRFNRTISGLAISIGLLLPLGLYAKGVRNRPSQTQVKQPLFAGVDYERRFRQTPRPHMLHILTLDLTTPGLTPLVTPGQRDLKHETDTQAQTTSDFLRQFQLQLAVNAGYFRPFSESTPWDFYPHSGDRTDVLGEFISNGDRYSSRPLKWPKLCFTDRNRAIIVENVHCPEQTRHAVAGNFLLHPIPKSETYRQRPFQRDKPYPRTVAAIDQTGQKLWLIVVDGKQPHYSEGVLLSEIEHLLAELGAERGVNLDGGGSVTLVQAKQDKAHLLNAPIHGKWPMTERPIATHLGFYAPALPTAR